MRRQYRQWAQIVAVNLFQSRLVVDRALQNPTHVKMGFLCNIGMFNTEIPSESLAPRLPETLPKPSRSRVSLNTQNLAAAARASNVSFRAKVPNKPHLNFQSVAGCDSEYAYPAPPESESRHVTPKFELRILDNFGTRPASCKAGSHATAAG